MSVSLERLRRIRQRVLVSGGAEKLGILRAAFRTIRPTTFITDEETAHALLQEEV